MAVTEDRIAESDAGADLEAAIGGFAEKMFMSMLGSFEMLAVELGVRLGLYEALCAGPATPGELAGRAQIDARYAREWLEQQATAGVVTIDAEPVDGDPDRRVFALPLAHQICLLDADSLAFVAPAAKFAAAGALSFERVVAAYRDGSGVSFGEYGDEIRLAQAQFNRPQYVNLLATEWLATMPDVVARLEDGGRVADIGCGVGWSSISLAKAYPTATVHGFDLDEPSIADATAAAEAEGVTDRVRFEVRNADTAAPGEYDLVCCFEALHDMAHPVEALRVMRQLVTDDGAVLIVDERAADALTEDDPDPMQRLLYACSVVHCLPVGRSEEHSAATGTVMRTPTFELYAKEAGFTAVEVLPIEHDMFRFYRLR